MMKKVAISIGDLNGIGIELALQNHSIISQMVKPIYCIDNCMLNRASKRLGMDIPSGFQTVEDIAPSFDIEAGIVSAKAGAYSYASFIKAVELAKEGLVDAITTLPIHKKAWELAGIKYKGHTDALRDIFDADAIMMLGCPDMFVALYTEHTPLRAVADEIDEERLSKFLLDFYRTAKPAETVGVLGLNPHAGDDGVLGSEETIISKAIENANRELVKHSNSPIYDGVLVPDVAFSPKVRVKYSHFIAMYHDQGLAPLKALYFDESINVSLNLPILRTSVDHGTAFDIAYKGAELSGLSYVNAIKYVSDALIS